MVVLFKGNSYPWHLPTWNDFIRRQSISLRLPLGQHELSPFLMKVKAGASSLPFLEIHPQFLPGVLNGGGLQSGFLIESDDFARPSETDPPEALQEK